MVPLRTVRLSTQGRAKKKVPPSVSRAAPLKANGRYLMSGVARQAEDPFTDLIAFDL